MPLTHVVSVSIDYLGNTHLCLSAISTASLSVGMNTWHDPECYSLLFISLFFQVEPNLCQHICVNIYALVHVYTQSVKPLPSSCIETCKQELHTYVLGSSRPPSCYTHVTINSPRLLLWRARTQVCLVECSYARYLRYSIRLSSSANPRARNKWLLTTHTCIN